MSAPIDLLLPRLEAVRQTGPGRWLARCPAHEDGRPSLSIQETSDGVALIHCFAQCSPADITAAVGLGLPDLFPARPDQHRHHRGRQRPFLSARDVLAVLDHERLIVAAVASDLLAGRTPTDADMARLADVGRRIDRLREIVR